MPQVPVRPIAAILSLAPIFLFAATAVAQAPAPRQAPPQAQQAPAKAAQPAPPKPYKKVSVTLAPSVADPTLDAFRKQLADIAARKDRAALARLVVPKEFFWERENGNAADRDKSSMENFVAATGLDAKDGSGWQLIADYASESSASQVGDRKDFVCAPATPVFDEKEYDAILQATETDPGEWGYPLKDGIEVRDTAAPNAKILEKLGQHFVRVFPEDAPPTAASPAALRIVTLSGKLGYIPPESLLPLGVDQLCYIKQADGWKIAGYVGEGAAE